MADENLMAAIRAVETFAIADARHEAQKKKRENTVRARPSFEHFLGHFLSSPPQLIILVALTEQRTSWGQCPREVSSGRSTDSVHFRSWIPLGDAGRGLITDMVSERTRLLPVLIPGGQSSMYSGVPSGLDGHSETTGSASMIGMAVPTLLKAGQKLAKGCGKEEYLETFSSTNLDGADRLEKLHKYLPQSLQEGRQRHREATWIVICA